MPGRPDFSSAGTDGGGQILATQSRPEIAVTEITNTSSVAAGATETTEIYAPTGSVYNVLSATLYVQPAGSATTGTHTLQMRPLDAMSVTQGESDYTERLQLNESHWQRANSKAWPPDGAAVVEAVKSLRATENSPIAIKYYNDMDASNSNSRSYTVVSEEVSY